MRSLTPSACFLFAVLMACGGEEPSSDPATGGGTPTGSGGGDVCDVDVQSDPTHCGECGRSCYGGTCTAGRCDAFELGQGFGARTDGSVIVWHDATNAVVKRYDLATQQHEDLCALDIAATRMWPGPFIYGYDENIIACDPATKAVTMTPLDVGPAYDSVAIGDEIFFRSESNDSAYLMNRDGSNLREAMLPAGIGFHVRPAPFGSDIFASIQQHDAGGINDDAYGLLRFRSESFDTPETVIEQLESEGGVGLRWNAVDGSGIYVVRATGDVVRVDPASGAQEVITETPSGSTRGLAVSADALYLIGGDADGFGLFRAPKTGGTFTRLASFDTSPEDLFLFGDLLVWSVIQPPRVYAMRVD